MDSGELSNRNGSENSLKFQPVRSHSWPAIDVEWVEGFFLMLINLKSTLPKGPS
jgi:hypothetical protein